MVILLVEGMLLRVLPRRAAFPAILAAVVLYCLLVGAEGSIVRAGIMGALVAFGKTFGRKGDLINILLFAGALMVLFRPALLLYDVGFQLSVVATFGLLTAADAVSGRLAFLPVALEFRETAAASVTALLFTLPISLLTFGALPLFTLAANLLSVPLLPFASLLGGAAVLLGMAFAPLGQAAALLAEGILFFIIRIAEGFAKLPGSRVPLPAFSAWVLVAVSLGGIVLFLLVRRLRRGHAA
jgi:competence protein ComEC